MGHPAASIRTEAVDIHVDTSAEFREPMDLIRSQVNGRNLSVCIDDDAQLYPALMAQLAQGIPVRRKMREQCVETGLNLDEWLLGRHSPAIAVV
jgi:hypothetical protein